MIRQLCGRLITRFWTRFLRGGYRFGVVPERLVFYRTHPDGVTHADPRGTFLEMSFATLRNLVPVIERLAAWPSLSRIIEAWIGNPEFAALRPLERYRLLGMLLADPPVGDFTAFRRAITDGIGHYPDLALVTAGRRLLAQASHTVSTERRLNADITAFVEARDYWQQSSQRWEVAAQEAAVRESAALLASQALAEAHNQLDQILQSTMWKATFPLRRLGSNHPGVARRLRQATKLVWWLMRIEFHYGCARLWGGGVRSRWPLRAHRHLPPCHRAPRHS